MNQAQFQAMYLCDWTNRHRRKLMEDDIEAKGKQNVLIHWGLWIGAVLLYFLIPWRLLKVVALDVRALVINLYKLNEFPEAPAYWAELAIKWGALPLCLLFFASVAYKLAGKKTAVANPFVTLAAPFRVLLGTVAFLPFIAFAIPFSFGMGIWYSIEAFWWIQWYENTGPAMDFALFTLPWYIFPVILVLGLMFLWIGLSKPRLQSYAKSTSKFTTIAKAFAGTILLIALLAVFAVPGLHLSRIGYAKGMGTFTAKCGGCHSGSRPLFFIKTPAEWERTLDRMQNFEKAPINDREKTKVSGFIKGMRSYSDKWTFTTRCKRCHGMSTTSWEKRTSEDWAAILDRLERWSPYYYRSDVKGQVQSHLAVTKTDEKATLGLSKEDYDQYVKFGRLCSACHSISRSSQIYESKTVAQLATLVERMNDKMPAPLSPSEIEQTAVTYKKLTEDKTLFAKLYPHDRPVTKGGPPW